MILDILSHLSLSWILLGTIAVLSLYWLWSKTRRPYLKYNIPPFPVPPMPIFGHFFMLRFNMKENFREWQNKAGGIFSLDILGRHQVIITDFDLLKEALIKNADSVTNTPHAFTDDCLKEDNKGIVGARDENWKEQRTTTLGILRQFGMGQNILAQKIQEEVTIYTEELTALKGQPKNIRDLTTVSIANVVCSIIIGERFGHDDPYFLQFIQEIKAVLLYFNRVPIVSAFPILYYLPGDLFCIKKLVAVTDHINEEFSKFYIRKFKEKFSEHGDPENFIVSYLQEMNKRKNQEKGTHLSEENLVAIIRTLFVAGTDSTAATMLWCLLYMLHNPDVQEKVHEEIKEHVGTERPPNMSDKPKLKYLSAVIMETQRIAMVTPTALRREVGSQMEVGGYTIPKGTVIWPIISRILHSKEIWGDPEKFRPERFLDDKGNLLNPEELIPFNLGKRTCLGQALALMELYLFLSRLFQIFKFEPADKDGPLPPLVPVGGVALAPQPYEIKFISRTGHD